MQTLHITDQNAKTLIIKLTTAFRILDASVKSVIHVYEIIRESEPNSGSLELLDILIEEMNDHRNEYLLEARKIISEFTGVDEYAKYEIFVNKVPESSDGFQVYIAKENKEHETTVH